MSDFLFRGDPCSRCPEARIPHAATHHGMCGMCWAGATEPQRRGALLDELADRDPLEDLYRLAARRH